MGPIAQNGWQTSVIRGGTSQCVVARERVVGARFSVPGSQRAKLLIDRLSVRGSSERMMSFQTNQRGP